MNKRLHVYEWDHEPKEERHSTFGPTGFESTISATVSGYHPMMDPSRLTRRPARFGFKTSLLVVAVLLALGAWVLARFLPLLKMV